MKQLENILQIAAFTFPLSSSITLSLFAKDKNTQKIKIVILLSASFLFFAHYLYPISNSIQPLYAAYKSIQFFIIPAIYIYYKSMFEPISKLRHRWLHFIPATLILLSTEIANHTYANAQRIMISDSSHFVFLSIQGLIYTTLYIHLIRNGNHSFKSPIYFGLKRRWSNRINKSQFIFTFPLITYSLIYLQHPIHSTTGVTENLIVFVISIYICFVAYGVFAQTESIPSSSAPLESTVITKVRAEEHYSSKTEKEDLALMNKLIECVEQKQVYLQADITLTALCRELGTNRTYLSAVINQHLNVNFATFINQYRIQHIQCYLKSHPNAHNRELALISGFGSISSMKRAMQKISQAE